MKYSVFGSILTIGAMIGAAVSGKIADYVGRRAVSEFVEDFPQGHCAMFFVNSPNEILGSVFKTFFFFWDQNMGIAELVCLAGWIAIGISDVCTNPNSLVFVLNLFKPSICGNNLLGLLRRLLLVEG